VVTTPPPESFAEIYTNEVLGGLGTNILLFATISGAAYAYFYYQRARAIELSALRLDQQLSEARLEALRSQLNPHFLLNALNSIAMLARDGLQAEAVRMIAGLSELLRYALDDARPQTVTLQEEIDFVTRYLAIEQVRFGERLQIEVDVDEQLLTEQVPSLAVHTLVENAIRHGISQRRGTGVVRVTATSRDVPARMVIEVSDNGVGLTAARDGSRGIGLANTRARLHELYGTTAALTIVDRETMEHQPGVIATLTLPRAERTVLADAVHA
jgi:two-component system LytT family sensor kinase